MKEIKAYIRRSRINRVVEALQKVGAAGITVVEIHPVGYGYEWNYFDPQRDELFQAFKTEDIRERRLEIVKLEVVCADRDVDRLIKVVLDESHTGIKGDGLIFVSDICQAVRVRDFVTGEEALSEPPKGP